jgi:NAD(P)-dependent dehydrogenase (short-subunit alcohol dehydrogenase family)
MRLEDSVVLVTGGASGLGEAVARRAVGVGARGVAILDLSEEKSRALALELGSTAIAVPCDITVPGQVTEAIDAVVETFGHIDSLVSCAGIPWAQRTVDREGNAANLDAYRKVIEVNLIGTFDVVCKTAAAMSRNEPNDDGERGVIIMTASVAAFDGQIGQAAYSASKGGIVGMTLPLARDLGAVGIRVATIAPGLIDTPIYDFAPPELKENLAKTVVFPHRLGLPAEFAHLAQSIIENAYLNGEVIRLDAAVRMPPKS